MNVGVEKLNSSQDERICDAAEPTGTHRTAMRRDTAPGEHQGRTGRPLLSTDAASVFQA